MKAQTIHREQFVWESLPSKKSGWKIAGKKEGLHLPNSVTEDVGGLSLMSSYSRKQLRSMGRREKARNQWRFARK